MIYLDTSAAVPMFVPEPATDRIAAWFESCEEPVVSSDWILPEFSSALSMKVRRGELTIKQARSAWAEFESFSQSGLRLTAVTRGAFERAAQLVRVFPNGLRSGDSLHLAMAIETKARSIATIDVALEKNAKTQGIGVTQF
jgi:uncharacterized protein